MAEMKRRTRQGVPMRIALMCIALMCVASACRQDALSNPRIADDPRTAPNRLLVPEEWGLIARYAPGLSVTLLKGAPPRPRTFRIGGYEVFGRCGQGEDCLGFVGRVAGHGAGAAGARFLYLVSVHHRDDGGVIALVDSVRHDSGKTVVTRQGLELVRDPHMQFVGCGRASTRLAPTGLRYILELDEVTGRIKLARCLRRA